MVTPPSGFISTPGTVLSTPASFWSVGSSERVWLSSTVKDQKSLAGIGREYGANLAECQCREYSRQQPTPDELSSDAHEQAAMCVLGVVGLI